MQKMILNTIKGKLLSEKMMFKIDKFSSILSLLIKVHPTKTVIEKNSTVLHGESDSLSNLDRRVFRPSDFFCGCTFTSKLLLDNVIISRDASLEPTFKDHNLLYILTSYLLPKSTVLI